MSSIHGGKAIRVPNLSRSHPQHHSSLHHHRKQDRWRWAPFSFFLFQSLTLIAPKPNHGDWIQLMRRKRWLGRRYRRRRWVSVIRIQRNKKNRIGIGFRLVMRLYSKPTPRYHSLCNFFFFWFWKMAINYFTSKKKKKVGRRVHSLNSRWNVLFIQKKKKKMSTISSYFSNICHIFNDIWVNSFLLIFL